MPGKFYSFGGGRLLWSESVQLPVHHAKDQERDTVPGRSETGREGGEGRGDREEREAGREVVDERGRRKQWTLTYSLSLSLSLLLLLLSSVCQVIRVMLGSSQIRWKKLSGQEKVSEGGGDSWNRSSQVYFLICFVYVLSLSSLPSPSLSLSVSFPFSLLL